MSRRERELVPLLRLAVPLAAGQLAGLGQVTEVVVAAGHAGPATLGAVGVGEGVWSLAYIACIGMANALPAVVANLQGAGRRDAVGAAFGAALCIALAWGTGLGLLLAFGSPALLAAARIDPALRHGTTAFLRALAPAAPACALYLACRGLSDGLGLTRPGMVANIMALIGLPGLLWLSLHADQGAGAAGLAGAAILLLQLGGFAAWLLWSPAYRGLGSLRPSLAVAVRLLRLGLPMAAGVVMEASLFSAVGVLAGRFGAVAAASHALALNCVTLAFTVPLGLSIALTVRVGNANGRGDRAGARRAGRTGMAVALAFELMTASLFILRPDAVVGLFGADSAVTDAAAALLRIGGVFQLADGLQVTAAGALRGLQDVAVPVLLTATAYWAIGLPLALLLGFAAGWGVAGLWTGLVAALATAAVLLSLRFALVTRRPRP